MKSAAPSLLPTVTRQRNVIVVVLVGLAAAGWVVFLDQARQPMGTSMPMGDMDTDGAGLRPDLTMDGSWLFLGMWLAMMVAMMFPAAVPMVTMYGRMRRRDPVSIALFNGSYIVSRFVFGVAAFVMSHWRDGRAGAVRMGMRHGAYCMGCCWLLFLILVPIGVMNVAAMAVISLLVFVEKATPWSPRFTHAGAVVLIGYGIAVMARPALLPTVA